VILSSWATVAALFLGYLVIFGELAPEQVRAQAVALIWPESFVVMIVAALLLAVAAIKLADRVIPLALGAHRARPDRRRDRRIRSSFETLGLAAGVDPILYLIDDVEWIDVASLGRRGDRPVVVTTTAAAELDRRDLDTLAALGLAESLLGSRAARYRRVSRVGWAILMVALRGWPLLIAWNVVQYLAVWGVFRQRELSLFANEGEAVPLLGQIGIMLAAQVFFGLWAGLFIAMLAGLLPIAFGWAKMMSKVTIDLGALALLRDPRSWWDCMVQLVDRQPTTPRRARRLADWAVPVGPATLGLRRRQVEADLPAAAQALAGRPYPEWDGGLSSGMNPEWDGGLSSAANEWMETRGGVVSSLWQSDGRGGDTRAARRGTGPPRPS
jgi:hypothetical protein